MAKVYGKPGAEKDLLKICPPEINCSVDVETFTIKYKLEKDQKRAVFDKETFDLVKNNKEKIKELESNKDRLIKEYTEKLVKLKDKKSNSEKIWNEKINETENKINYYKNQIKQHYKIKLIFSLLYLKFHHKIQSIAPKQLKEIKTEIIKTGKEKSNRVLELESQINILKSTIKNINKTRDTEFENKEKDLINKIEALDKAFISEEYHGAKGESAALEKLEKLPSDFHIFCDVKIKRQMDFVVVGPTGIFVIEVKNWTPGYTKDHLESGEESPHEQVDDAGTKLFYFLKDKFNFDLRVRKVIIPVKMILDENPNLPFVKVKSLKWVNSFITNSKNVFSTPQIDNIVKNFIQIT
jgi:hypothetical protein